MKYALLLFVPIVFGCAADRTNAIDQPPPDPTELASLDTDKTLFVWDFTEPKTYVYKMQMETNTTVDMAGENPLGNMDMSQVMELTYLVRAKENGRADVIMQDMDVIKAPMAGMEEMMEGMLPQEPTILIRDMTAGGDIDSENAVSIAGVQMNGAISPLMLPSRDLRVGESDTLVFENDMDIDGMNMNMKQRAIITFAGYEEYEGRNCAVLVTEYILDENEVSINDPELGEGGLDMDIDMNTGSRFYWDPVGHYFVGAEIIIDGNTAMNGTGAMADMPEGMNVRVNMVQRIRLEGIED